MNPVRFKRVVSTTGRTLGTFGALQILAQGAQIATALLVIRTLPKDSYAWYSMVIALQSAMATFAASGMGPAMMAMGGPVAHDPQRLGSVIVSSLRLRRLLVVVAGVVAAPVYAYLLHRNGCPPLVSAAMLLAAAIMLLQAIRQELLVFPLNLNQQYHVPQVANLLMHLGRGVLIVGLLLAAWNGPVLYLFAGIVLTALVLHFYLLPRAATCADRRASVDPQLLPRFRSFALNGLLPSLSTIFQSQIGLFLISIFGNVSSVADLGALMRLGLVILIPLAAIQSILVPKLARAESPAAAAKVWLFAVMASALAGFLLAVVVYFLRDQVTMLFGTDYASLGTVVTLYAASLGLVVFAATCESLINARGWLRHSWARPVFVIVAQVFALPWLDLSSLRGVIYLSIIGGVAYQIFNAFLIIRGLYGRGSL
jgi:O-antigen/teichoic acid export membrane protein